MFQISTAERKDRCVLYSNIGIFLSAQSTFEEYKPVKVNSCKAGAVRLPSTSL